MRLYQLKKGDPIFIIQIDKYIFNLSKKIIKILLLNSFFFLSQQRIFQIGDHNYSKATELTHFYFCEFFSYIDTKRRNDPFLILFLYDKKKKKTTSFSFFFILFFSLFFTHYFEKKIAFSYILSFNLQNEPYLINPRNKYILCIKIPNLIYKMVPTRITKWGKRLI